MYPNERNKFLIERIYFKIHTKDSVLINETKQKRRTKRQHKIIQYSHLHSEMKLIFSAFLIQMKNNNFTLY